jgi:PilZ domain
VSKALNSRRESRHSVAVNARLTVAGQIVVVRTRDISRSGICLISDSEIPREKEVGISLVLSLGKEATSEPLALTGMTAWCTPMFGKYQVGVRFVALNGDRRRYLDLFMRFIEGEVGPSASDGDSGEIHTSKSPLEDKDDPFRP